MFDCLWILPYTFMAFILILAFWYDETYIFDELSYTITWLDDRRMYKAEYKWYNHNIILFSPVHVIKKKKRIGKWNFEDTRKTANLVKSGGGGGGFNLAPKKKKK